MYSFDRNEYECRMKWFLDARFGMFIHWGLYAIPARGEWVRSTEQMEEADYMRYFYEFDPKFYDPVCWARAAKRAGMKYIILTAKHHDGFCLFDTATTGFKSTDTKLGRDIVKDFTDAARAEGLHVGLYYSLIDWHHKDFPHYGDRQHPMRNRPECTNEGRDFNRYLDYMHAQVRELCTNYGKIDIMWFDFSYDDMRGEKWRASKLVDMVRTLQPDIILNNRLECSGEGFGSLAEGQPTPYHGDFVSPEKIIPPCGIFDPAGNLVYWEVCATMNQNWGYCGTDNYYKSADMLIKKLVECVSKGGNFLLNIGPDANGAIPPRAAETLEEIGRFMRLNSQSIYGCTKSAVPKPEWGRITQKGNELYLHVYENTLGPLPLFGINAQDIDSIRQLSGGRFRFRIAGCTAIIRTWPLPILSRTKRLLTARIRY